MKKLAPVLSLLVFCSVSLDAFTKTTHILHHSKEHSMLFNNDKIWKRYKNIYNKLNNANSLKRIYKLELLSEDVFYTLEISFPNDPQVINDLEFLMNDEIRRAAADAQKSPGKQPPVDYYKELIPLNDRITVEIRLIDALLNAHVDDRWVKATIYAGLGISIELIQVKLGLLEKQIMEKSRELSNEQKNTIALIEQNLKTATTLFLRTKSRKNHE